MTREEPPARRAVTVPANLLLLGEYAVLEEGGLGLAVAPDIRAHGRVTVTSRDNVRGRQPARRGPVVRGVGPSGTLVWPGDAGVLGAVADYLAGELGRVAGEIEIDTSPFYHPDGRKRGYGSSAAMTVALTALWLDAAPAVTPDEHRVIELAVNAHRAAQNGRGSGYDIAVSTLGGIVLFTGGARPQARRVELPWLPAMTLVSGPNAVATPDAIGRYREWTRAEPTEATRFLRRSNELVEAFASASSWEEAAPLFREYTRLTVALGAGIGVPAEVTARAERDGEPLAKAVGAGNELGVALGVAPGADGSEQETITVAEEGLRWE